ncbi:MAG: 3-hydroxyacyl-CoA dehydrogenase family protein [Polyangiales bacterium]
MKLLELVVGPDTDPAVYERVRAFGVDGLGKGIVLGKDTPNFVGNRIGAHSMMLTLHEMLAQGLSVEDVDNITGEAMAHPKTASFRTADLVGLDTFVHVADNCYQSLTEDEDRDVFKVPAFVQTMVEKVPREQDQGQLLQEEGRRHSGHRPEDRRVPREGWRRGHQEDDEGHREDRRPARACEGARGGHGPRRQVRVDGHVAFVRVLGAAHPGNRRPGVGRR